VPHSLGCRRMSAVNGTEPRRPDFRERARPLTAAHLSPDWWWTVTRKATRCHSCRESVPRASLIAYNHHGGELRCELCADAAGISVECKPSKRFRARAVDGLNNRDTSGTLSDEREA
jgi:hypothetical protein